jgi:hypothetical protein
MSDIPSDLAKDDVSVAASTASSSNRGTQRRQQRGSINANHLLNFQSGPRDTRNTESATNRRRPASIRSSQRPAAYDRTKFLQANFRFNISDASEIQKYEADPDLMLNWDDIAAVDVVATTIIQCPITLSPPLCPCITPCGHIFSEEAIMAHMITQGGPELRISSACPICTTEVTARELRPVTIKQVGNGGSGSGNDSGGSSIVSAGDRIKLRLLKRGKDSIIPHPVGVVEGQLKEESTAAEEIPCNIYAKFTPISDPMPLWSQRVKILAKKSVELIREGGLDTNYEVPSILAAIEAMANRARVWTERRHRLLIEKLDDEDMAVALAGGALPAAEVAGKEAMAAVTRIAEVASREEEEMYKKSVAVHKLEEAFPALSVSSTMDKPTMVVVPPPTTSPPSTSIESLNLKNTTEERNKLSSSLLQQQQQPAAAASLPPSEIYFYQSGDGQLIFLNPLNMRMLLESTGGSYTSLPHEIDALVLELEEIEQTEATRKRLKGCCGHLPLRLSFKLCEVDLREILPAEVLAPFEAELIHREKKRVQLAKLEARKTHREAIKAKSMEAAKAAAATGPTAAELAAMPLPGASTEPVAVPRASVEEFRGDEDEAGPSPSSSSSFPGGSSAGAGAGISFARMAKMGFAATGPALGEGLGSPPTPPWGSNAAVSGSSPGVASGVWGTTTTTNKDSSSISAQIDAALSLAASATGASGGGGKKKGRKITLLSTSHRR